MLHEGQTGLGGQVRDRLELDCHAEGSRKLAERRSQCNV